MPVDIAETIVIERPIATVAAFAGDPTNAARWRRRVESAAEESEPPTRLGSRFQIAARVLGRTVEHVYEVVEWEPGEQVSIRTTDGLLPLRIVSTWRPVGQRVTHMVLRQRLEPVGIARLIAPFTGSAIRRSLRRDLAELKRVLEAT